MNVNYWNERIKKTGTTGWSDPIVYAFDQGIRVRVIKTLLKEKSGGVLLDYGCGTGDFSKALEEQFESIYLYDISDLALNIARNRIENAMPIKIEQLNLNEYRGLFDVILSITVLQHIVNDEEMNYTLDCLNNSLKKGGWFLVLESFFEQGNSVTRNWGCAEFETLMKNKGFAVCEKYNFYYPDEKNNSYSRYSRRIDTKILGKLYSYIKYKKFRRIILSRLRRIASRYNFTEGEYYNDFSAKKGTKIYLLSKI